MVVSWGVGGPVLVVDDDAGVRALLNDLLSRVGLDVVEAADGERALEAAAASHPLLVLLDVGLPGIGGYEVCRELRERFGDPLPIIFLSGERVDPTDKAAGLLLGADDYLVKPFDPTELMARVRRLISRSAAATDHGRENGEHPSIAALTPREREVLELLAKGVSQLEISRRLVISPKTAGTHIQNILGKLGVHSRAEAVALAHRYRLVA